MQGKASSEQSAATQVYVGIDACKAWLDVHIHPIGQSFRVANTGKGSKQLRRKLLAYDVALLVMEATGKYHRQAHRVLHEVGFAVAIVNPLRARRFAEAVGALAKNDRIDAKMLAVMGESLKPEAIAPGPALRERLKELMRGRQTLVDQKTALSNQLGEAGDAVLKRELNRLIKQVADASARLETEILRLIGTDPALERRFKIVLSIPGVGPIAAVWLVVGLAELGACSARRASHLAGLAPLDDDSGDRKGIRRIRGGRADVRRGIYMAAVAATRCNPDLKAFYDRLIARGKEFKRAITAVMRKLVVLASILLTQDRQWQLLAPKRA
jgi:transposase